VLTDEIKSALPIHAMKNTASLLSSELVLWGLPEGVTESWREVLLTHGTAARIAEVKTLAARDGFHSFRTARVNLATAPNFARTVNV